MQSNNSKHSKTPDPTSHDNDADKTGSDNGSDSTQPLRTEKRKRIVRFDKKIRENKTLIQLVLTLKQIKQKAFDDYRCINGI